MTSQTDRSQLPDILQDFDSQALGLLSPNSRKVYLHKLVEFFKWLETQNITLERFNRKIVSKYVSYLKEKGNKPRTIQVKLAAIKKFAKWLWEEDKLGSKELQKIQDIQLRIPQGEIAYRALPDDEIALALKKISHPIHRFLFWCGINYGLRNQEYCKLKVSDVDLSSSPGILTINNSKGEKTRRIPINSKQKRKWQEWIQQREVLYRPDHEYVFLTVNGKIMNRSLERYFNKISEMVYSNGPKKRFTSHDLRKTYATRLWLNEVDIFIISFMLGHSSVVTTQKYLAVTEKEIHERYIQSIKKFKFM